MYNQRQINLYNWKCQNAWKEVCEVRGLKIFPSSWRLFVSTPCGCKYHLYSSTSKERVIGSTPPARSSENCQTVKTWMSEPETQDSWSLFSLSSDSGLLWMLQRVETSLSEIQLFNFLQVFQKFIPRFLLLSEDPYGIIRLSDKYHQDRGTLK